MTSIERSKKSEQTKTNIIQAYIHLMAKKSWDRITVKELCVEAAITRGTFYQYYNSIYDLMEQIEQPLLQELEDKYRKTGLHTKRPAEMKPFRAATDCAPPASFSYWLQLCQENKETMRALLSENGDQYFVSKTKVILGEYINQMMNYDGMPEDGLRSHFHKAFVELHLLTARTWLSSDEVEFLSMNEILSVLNTLRVGANYMSYLDKAEKDAPHS